MTAQGPETETGPSAAPAPAALAPTVRRDEKDQQYELVVDGDVASVLGYETRGQTVVLLHTATAPGLRGRGHATALVQAVMADIAVRGLSPTVRCPFIRSYLRRTSASNGPP